MTAPAPTNPWARAEPRPPRPTVGFLTDSTLCIGCKACEVACKQWNRLPADGTDWLGISYDNTGHLGGDTWRHVKFLEQFDARPRGRTLAVRLRRLQALRGRRLHERLPHRGDRPHRVRHRVRAGRHLQRVRLLRRRVSLRGHRPLRDRPRRPQVHPLLRPAADRRAARLREGVPDRVDRLRSPRRARRARPRRGSRSSTAAARAGARLWGDSTELAQVSTRSSSSATTPGGTGCRCAARTGRHNLLPSYAGHLAVGVAWMAISALSLRRRARR